MIEWLHWRSVKKSLSTWYQMNEWMNEWMNDWTNERMHAFTCHTHAMLVFMNNRTLVTLCILNKTWWWWWWWWRRWWWWRWRWRWWWWWLWWKSPVEMPSSQVWFSSLNMTPTFLMRYSVTIAWMPTPLRAAVPQFICSSSLDLEQQSRGVTTRIVSFQECELSRH